MAKKQTTNKQTTKDRQSPLGASEPASSSAPEIEEVRCLWLGDSASELGWFRDRLIAAWPTLSLETARLQAAFANHIHPTHLFLASRSRSDSLVDNYADARAKWPNSEIVVVLGAWWTGHRRCQPLPDSWVTHYWYEWWDRTHALIQPRQLLAPDALEVPSGWNARIARIRSELGHWEAESNRVSTKDRISKLALVTCADRTAQEMWETILSGFGFQPIFRRNGDPIPQASWSVHVVDAASYMVDAAHTDLAALSKMLQRDRLPFAKCLVRTGFPEYAGWRHWQAAGADWIVGSPCHMLGLKRILASLDSDSILGSRLPTSASSR